MGKSPIQWTGDTHNTMAGCFRKHHGGCDGCYAFALHDQRHIAWKRGNFPTAPAQYHVPFSHVQLLPERLLTPFGWQKPRLVFLDSMSDLFYGDHEDLAHTPPSHPMHSDSRSFRIQLNDHVAAVWAMMALTPQHTYQILTKRPHRMRSVLSGLDFYERVLDHAAVFRERFPRKDLGGIGISNPSRFPLANVWLGTSVENQAAADERIPHLLETPAAVRFLSCEPLLGPVDLDASLWEEAGPAWAGRNRAEPGLDWVIVGGESGPRARPMGVVESDADEGIEWAHALIQQCRAADTPVFVKQLGSVWAARRHAHNKHGGDMADWPTAYQIREFPVRAGELVGNASATR